MDHGFMMGIPFVKRSPTAHPSSRTLLSESSVIIEQSTICGNSIRQIFGSFVDNGGNTITEECSSHCPGDYNLNGYVDLEDLLQVISNWQSPHMLEDLLLVLSQWGTTCM